MHSASGSEEGLGLSAYTDLKVLSRIRDGFVLACKDANGRSFAIKQYSLKNLSQARLLEV